MQLIKIEPRQIAGATIQTCNARDLWQFVESKQDFSTWIKSRIEKYGFIEGEDFTIHKFVESRATIIDYHLTIETAKELAMVENNEKGREVRRYFIECERRTISAQQIDFNDPAFLRTTLLSYTEKVLELQEVVAEQAPKVAALERLSKSEGSLGLRASAAVLGLKQNQLITWLLENGWVYRNPNSFRLHGYAVYLGRELESKEVLSTDETRAFPQLFITPLGISRIARRLEDESFEIPEPVPAPPPMPTLAEVRAAAASAQGRGVPIPTLKAIITSCGAEKSADINPVFYLALIQAFNKAEPF